MPYVMQGLSDFFLAVGIGVGRIKIVDAGIIGTAQQPLCVGGTDALNRQSAKSSFRDPKVCFSQSNFFNFHGNSSLFPGFFHCNESFLRLQDPQRLTADFQCDIVQLWKKNCI